MSGKQGGGKQAQQQQQQQQGGKRRGGTSGAATPTTPASGASSGGGGAGNWDAEDVLQAVVIGDSFNSRFTPITMEQPRTLLPLCNAPLIDYTLEFLISANVQEIFVICCSHADLIKQYIEGSQWVRRQGVTITCIVQPECLSVGDALRNIDQLAIIRSDFILVSGDLISNMKLAPVLATHRLRREKDKGAIMTMVMKTASPAHRTRSLERDSVVAVESNSQRLLAFRQQRSPNATKFVLPVSVFKEHAAVQVRYDLYDCHINICSAVVPVLFTDNFDYQDIYDLVHGILDEEEILGNKIFIHELNNEYAARVDNLRAYNAVSKDVIHRWTFPMVPDYSSEPGEAYKYGRNNIYQDERVLLSRSCNVVEDVVIGKGTKVGENSQITCSTIGRNCVIGAGVTIENSYIWDNVEIEDGCTIKNAVLCNKAKILRNVAVESGSIISFNVVVGPDVVIPAHSKLTMLDEDGNLPDSDTVFDSKVVGTAGAGHNFVVVPEDFAEDELEHLKWGVDIVHVEDADVEDSDDSLFGDDTEMHMEAPEDIFMHEIRESIQSVALGERNVDVENIVVEINGSKHAYNIEARDLAGLIVQVVMEVLLEVNPTAPHTALKTLCTRKNPVVLSLLKRYVSGQQADQLSSITAIANVLAEPEAEAARGSFLNLVHKLYDFDVLGERAIQTWFKQNADEPNEIRAKLRASLQRLITWLAEAEEESDDDDEDEDDDDDDEDDE
ncbi:translation initiation factor eIF-2B subunit epsilon [Capsaspora owczarzaki ATCC 30864]|uniref:Translation initiation factor eIF2B subunit epsilon n=1 Tax=Capsaspora owczarzaki (strain ATCC 30864) TaxID=595528 RepID=A0A0D2VGC7_CAPO3|nr:translation initiation factor eIF-2B subunit epsilon [Capsaspora owczarzaki ATCC 30864]KJE88922.1 translation initiation factor eIF-2B subunit epsilon [Capsaspora owczarzaki ATCC 30864]|eukprot:XP_004365364.2 translation initiation factor eIF-2B subunit epsilon [Capsaspora owczarzaki ATCC 30864]